MNYADRESVMGIYIQNWCLPSFEHTLDIKLLKKIWRAWRFSECKGAHFINRMIMLRFLQSITRITRGNFDALESID